MTPFLRRSLAFGAVTLLLGLIVRMWPDSSAPAVVAPSADTVAAAEKRLANLRDLAAAVPAKEEILKRASGELAAREKGLLVADTAAQAQAQLVQIFRELGKAENPPVEIRSTDSFNIHPFGDAYGEATVAVNFECHVEQLINILSAIAARPDLVSTSDIRVTASNAKDKTIGARITLAGVVPRKLVPERHS